MISFRIDWFDLLAIQRTLKSLLYWFSYNIESTGVYEQFTFLIKKIYKSEQYFTQSSFDCKPQKTNSSGEKGRMDSLTRKLQDSPRQRVPGVVQDSLCAFQPLLFAVLVSSRVHGDFLL